VPATGLEAYTSSRKVLAAPLQVFSWPERKARTLVTGKVWVWSADWRQAPKQARAPERMPAH